MSASLEGVLRKRGSCGVFPPGRIFQGPGRQAWGGSSGVRAGFDLVWAMSGAGSKGLRAGRAAPLAVFSGMGWEVLAFRRD